MFSASLDTLAHEQMGQCVQTSGKEIFDKLDQCVKTIANIFSASLDISKVVIVVQCVKTIANIFSASLDTLVQIFQSANVS